MRVVTYTDREAEIMEQLAEWGLGSTTLAPDVRAALVSADRALRQNRKPRTTDEQAAGQRELGREALAREAAGG